MNTIYRAYDGKEFTSEFECKEHEERLDAKLKAKAELAKFTYEECVVTTIKDCQLFGFYDFDNDVDILKATKEQWEDIIFYLKYTNEFWNEKLIEKCFSKYTESDLVVIMWNYDRTYMIIHETFDELKKDIIKDIDEAFELATKKGNENE